MKKIEKYIYIALLLIVVGVLASGVTYMFVNNKSDDKISENDKEEIILSEKELEEYLSYVPKEYIYNLSTQLVTSENIVKENLMVKSIYHYIAARKSLFNNLTNLESVSISTKDIDEELSKMYDTKIDFNKINEYQDDTGLCINYNESDETLEANYCYGNDLTLLNKLIKYEIKFNSLIIYDYNASYGPTEYEEGSKKTSELRKFNSNYVVKFTNEENAKDYFKKHANEFTQYKHTFKKNDTGYYWYSTEVVK